MSLKLRTLWLAQRFTGMRSGDSTSLLWEDINWAEHEVNVPNNKTRDPRIITMHQVFEDKLRAWWEESGRPTSGLVFPTSKGTQYAKRGTTFAAQLREALKRAGVTRRELFEETDRTLPVDDHSIRRLYCTSLASAGVNLQTAMNLAGHTSADVHSRYLRVTKSMTTLPGGAIDGFADGIVSAEHSLNHIKTATNEATPSPHMGE